MSRTQQQQQKNNQKTYTDIGGFLSPQSQLNVPSTAHSCENPFRFIARNTQDSTERGEGQDNKSNPLSSIEDDDITTQRKLLLQKLKKIESRKQQNSFNYKRDNNSWSNELNLCSSYKQGPLPINQKEYCFTFNDDISSQKTLTEQSVGGHLQQQQTQQKNSIIQSSPNQTDENASSIKKLKGEIDSMKNELENSQSTNIQLKNDLRIKIQQIEDLQREYEKFNSQQQQQEFQNLKGGRNNASRSIESNIINRQKEEIAKLYNIIAQNNIHINPNNFNSAYKKNPKDSQQQTITHQNYLKIAQTEPDLRDEEFKHFDEREYIYHIQKLQKKIEALQESDQNKQNQASNNLRTLNNQDQIDNQLQQQLKIKSNRNMQHQIINFERKNSDCSPIQNQKQSQQISNQIKNENGVNNQETIQFCQSSLLESDLFNNPQKNKEFGVINLIEMESFNISPIKNKSYKQDKSTICDKSCLQAILTIEELSYRAQKMNKQNPTTATINNSTDKILGIENLQEEIELKQNNFQNKIKKVLEINNVSQQPEQETNKIYQSRQDLSPNFYDFVQEIQQNEAKKQSPSQNNSKTNSKQKDRQFSSYNKNEQMITNNMQNQYEQDQLSQFQKNNKKSIDQQMKSSYDISQKQNSQTSSNTSIFDSKLKEQQRVNSLDHQRLSKYSKLEILKQQNTENLYQQYDFQYQHQIQNSNSKSEAVLNSQKIDSHSRSDKQKNNSGQIIQKISPHSTKEQAQHLKIIFDQSDCSMQFREEINHFNKIIEGKRRSSLNFDLTSSIQQENENSNQSKQYSNGIEKHSNSKKFINEKSTSSQQFNVFHEQKQSFHQNKTQPVNNSQNFNSQRIITDPFIHTENLRFYENGYQTATCNQQDQQLRAGMGVSSAQNLNPYAQRSNRVNSITQFENKHFVGSIVSSSSKKKNNHNTNSTSKGSKIKIDSSNSIHENANKLLHSQTNNVFVSSTPKGNQEQISSNSKQKLGVNLANGNSYHLQYKHHDKYDFYYSSSSNNITTNPTNSQSDDLSQNKKSQQNNSQYQNNKKNSFHCIQPNSTSSNHAQHNSNQSSGDLKYQNKVISNKQKKNAGMIINTITSRDYESIGVSSTSSSQIRKQIASTVNEAVRNSTQHLQIIQNSNNLSNSQSNQQFVSQQFQVSTNRNQDNSSIDSCSNRKQQEKNNYEQNMIQQNYHGLQKILNQHINKQPYESKANTRCPPSNLERLREVKNRVKELNLNGDATQLQPQYHQQKENLPPTPNYNIINSLFSANNYHEVQSAQNKNQIYKPIDNKSLENPNTISRRSSQGNQFSSINNKAVSALTNFSQQKNDFEPVSDKFSQILKEKINQKSNTQQKNDDYHNFAIKRNSSYNSHHSKNQNQSLDQNSRKSDSLKRSQKC